MKTRWKRDTEFRLNRLEDRVFERVSIEVFKDYQKQFDALLEHLSLFVGSNPTPHKDYNPYKVYKSSK